MKKTILTILLLLSLLLSACKSSNSSASLNLMDDMEKNDFTSIEIPASNEDKSKRDEITDFSLSLFKENFEDENILISPLSIVSALGMVTNGADGNTLKEMEQVLNSDIRGLNDYLEAYSSYLPKDEKYKLGLANAIWFKDREGLKIEEDFLQTNKDYYDADVFKSPFDNTTKDHINTWVEDKTDGMIEKLLEEPLSEDVIMYLVNALSFDAEWENIYNESQVYEDEFILENDERQTVEFMTSSEFSYLENKDMKGFIKPYKDSKYAFVGLLAKDEMKMKDLLDRLDKDSLRDLLENKSDEEVKVTMPKFSVEYSSLLNDSLKQMGIVDAFDEENADFTALGKSEVGNIYISRVIHKTKIDVDEKGTKAGAVTAVKMETKSIMLEEPKEVILNRPFFYMIIDTEQNLPLFMGSLMDVD